MSRELSEESKNKMITKLYTFLQKKYSQIVLQHQCCQYSLFCTLWKFKAVDDYDNVLIQIHIDYDDSDYITQNEAQLTILSQNNYVIFGRYEEVLRCLENIVNE